MAHHKLAAQIPENATEEQKKDLLELNAALDDFDKKLEEFLGGELEDDLQGQVTQESIKRSVLKIKALHMMTALHLGSLEEFITNDLLPTLGMEEEIQNVAINRNKAMEKGAERYHEECEEQDKD